MGAIPTPLKNDGVGQLGLWHSQFFGKNHPNVLNHQPDDVKLVNVHRTARDEVVLNITKHSAISDENHHCLWVESHFSCWTHHIFGFSSPLLVAYILKNGFNPNFSGWNHHFAWWLKPHFCFIPIFWYGSFLKMGYP